MQEQTNQAGRLGPAGMRGSEVRRSNWKIRNCRLKPAVADLTLDNQMPGRFFGRSVRAFTKREREVTTD